MKWDINLDAGESPEHLADGTEARRYRKVSRINIACGGHAGDNFSMEQCLELAKQLGISAGAHPSYPDPNNFGREVMALSTAQVTEVICEQVQRLKDIALRIGVPLTHVKPHGALYNALTHDLALADAVAAAVTKVDEKMALVGLAGTPALARWKELGFVVLAEGFADRGYRRDGTLVPRREVGAVITDPLKASQQARDLLENGRVKCVTGEWISVMCQTVCVHGDNPAADIILDAMNGAAK